MPARHRGRQTLGQGLDREIYQVVRKIIDEKAQFEETPSRLSSTHVYDEIRRSNSSLNRRPKKLLEDSIERVLSTIQQDIEESDSEGGLETPDKAATSPTRPPTNGLNRSIVGAWSTASPAGHTPKSSREQEQGQREKSVMDPSELTSKKRQPNGEPMPKKRKAAAAVDRSAPTHVSFDDLGGVDKVVEQFEELLVLPMKRPEYYINAGIQPPRGILIYGPPGCGKTMIANVFAAELRVNFISISAPSIVSGMSGESEKALRDYFEEAKKCAPCLMFIDEIDAITPKREGAQREMEKRIVAQLLTCMDDLALERTDGKAVIVLAATNRPDSLDSALRRGGRFDKEINMSVPNEAVREQILRALSRKSSMASDVDFKMLARRTPGFVGADLNDLVSTAGAAAIKRVLNVLKSNAEDSTMELDGNSGDGSSEQTVSKLSSSMLSFRRLVTYTEEHSAPGPTPSTNINPSTDETNTDSDLALPDLSIRLTLSDFLTSLPKIQPSALREGFATIPSTTFSSIGALDHHISELRSTIIEPILNPTLYASLGIQPSSGALLWGPPGCGKTLLAKAAANSSHANFISVKGPELLNKYVGESERAVRQVFNRARSSVPVIIFFDELDALVPRRDGTMSEASARVVNTLLTELDGVGQSRDGIYIIAATNRPDIIDPAMLRPGRLESLLFVSLPDAEGRVDILRTLCKKLPGFTWTDQIAEVARSCEGFSGADLDGLVKRAGRAAIKRISALRSETPEGQDVGQMSITLSDFQIGRAECGRSVSADDMKRYEQLQKQLGQSV